MTCGLTPATCLCASLPRLRFATPLVIVQHNRERHKPTNTGRLFARMVESAALIRYGFRGEPFVPGPLADPSIQWRLLFPRKGGPVVESPAPGTGFVLLDGTWSQASRMARRVPIVADLECVALPPGPPSIWTVRTQRDERGMSTFEAAVRALELAEGAEAVAPLREAFARVTQRILFLKGKRPTLDVV
jgi:DTW domain-containing protein